MKPKSKEWYEAVEFFERTVSNYGFGRYRFDKEINAPVGHWYQHGETNDAFRMFLYGLEYGKTIAAQDNLEGDLQQTHNSKSMPCEHEIAERYVCVKCGGIVTAKFE